MALEKETVVDTIEVLEDGVLQIREAIVVKEDGVVLSRTYHRYVLTPTTPVYSSGDNQKIYDIQVAVWTPEVVEAYAAAHPAP